MGRHPDPRLLGPSTRPKANGSGVAARPKALRPDV